MPLCFGSVGVGAHEAEAPVGVVRARRPHLLAVDDEVVAVEHRRGSAGSRGRCPAPGSLIPRHHAISARSVGSRNRSCCSGGAVVVDRRGDDAEALRVERCAGSRGATSPRSRSSAASASALRPPSSGGQPGHEPARVEQRRAATRGPTRAGRALDCFGSAAAPRAAAGSPRATRSARRGTPRPRRRRTAGASGREQLPATVPDARRQQRQRGGRRGLRVLRGPGDAARVGAPLPRRPGADPPATSATLLGVTTSARPPRSGTGSRELGVVGLLVPEEHGGAGMGMVDAAVVLEELGRAVHPGPYLVERGRRGEPRARSRARDDDQHVLLPGLADGSIVGTVALLEPGGALGWREPQTTAARRRRRLAARRHQGARRRRGRRPTSARRSPRRRRTAARRVRGHARADGVTVDRDPDGRRHPQGGDASRSTAPPARRLGAGDATDAVAATLDRVGVGMRGRRRRRRSSARSSSRSSTRRSAAQFDKPIGTFQAVQHLCADMLRAVELGRAAGYYACWACDDADAGEAPPRRDDGPGVRGDALYAGRRRARSRCSAASASRGSTTSTCSTSGCSRCSTSRAVPSTSWRSWRASCSTPDA